MLQVWEDVCFKEVVRSPFRKVLIHKFTKHFANETNNHIVRETTYVGLLALHIYDSTGVMESGFAPRYGAAAGREAWSTSARLKVAHLMARPFQKCMKFDSNI